MFTLKIQRNSSQQEICANCKTKIVDFLVFKRRNEDARAMFGEVSETPDNIMLLKVVDEMENITQNNKQQEEEEDATDEFLKHDDNENDSEIMQNDDLEYLTDSQEEPLIQYNSPDICFEDMNCSEVTIDSSTSSPSKKLNRQSNPETWLRNKRKLAKNTGQSYVASNGKFVEAKTMKNACGASCRMKCSEKVGEENRLRNFDHFYELADIARQRKFLFDHTKTYAPNRTKIPKNPQKLRAVQRNYFLDIDDSTKTLQVCKLMFLNTFTISSQMIDTLHRKAVNEGKFNDVRGKFKRKHLRPKPSVELATSMDGSQQKNVTTCP